MATRGSIGVLGIGDFGKAVTLRLSEVGYDVLCASRSPQNRKWSEEEEFPPNVVITTWPDAIARSDVLIIAIQAKHQASVLHQFRGELKSKILVDVSNPEIQDKNNSNAEKLAASFPDCHVIKAFNTLSAYDMDKARISNKPTHVCGDDLQSKLRILGLGRDMGINVIDYGTLKNAKELESLPKSLFDGWGLPVIITVIIVILWLGYAIFKYYFNRSKPFTWGRFPVNLTQKAFACSSLWLLSLCYIPGSLACFTHIIYGTKYRRFPAWLDRWLKMRKQLGLMAFYLALLHAVIHFLILNPAYFGKWFEKQSFTVAVNATTDIKVPLASRFIWWGETSLLFGILALVAMSILAVTSLPSVGQVLTWREWRFVQSYFGLFCLFLAAGHVTIKGLPNFVYKPILTNLQGLVFLSVFPAWVALALRIITFMPCVYYYVEKVRGGWSRDVPERDPERAINPKSHEVKTNVISNGGMDNPCYHSDDVNL